MANPRKEVTGTVAAYLKTPVSTDPEEYHTDAGRKVTDTDATPPDVDGLPEINVVFVRETIDRSSQHQDGLPGLANPKRRIMEMRIECYHVTSKADVDDLAWQVEEAMRANPTLGNTVESITLNDIDLFVAERGEFALYAAVMTYEVVYWTHEVQIDGEVPVTVLLGFVPETGIGNEPDYSAIIGGP